MFKVSHLVIIIKEQSGNFEIPSKYKSKVVGVSFFLSGCLNFPSTVSELNFFQMYVVLHSYNISI